MPAQENPIFEKPSDPNVLIWRYMDFTKFIMMLEHGGLFFPRADLIGDPFEGAYSKGNVKLRPLVYKDKGIPGKVFELFGKYIRWSRQWTMINCWHINSHESAAMWNLHAKTNEAIAIQSTYEKLRQELDEDCFLGVVKYIDYETDWLPEGSALAPFIYKRKSYFHEQELRAIIQKIPIKGEGIDYSTIQKENGIWKSVNLSNLINKVFVAPTSLPWFKELVEKVVIRFELKIDVVQSSLDEEPFF